AARDGLAARNVRTDRRTAELDANYWRRHRIASTLDVPILVDGRLDGVLCYEHVGRPITWTPEDRLFAAAVANFLALAVGQEERRRAEIALRESEQRLRRFTEDLPAGAVYVEGQRIYMNRGAEVLTGYDRNELQTVDAWFRELYPGRDARILAQY